ncbi:SDR family oxidoreductase [Fibrella sp. WM1]|uniref:SDR family oxidoreductase n=1 Tax=Fibrella musci TaxID=3242485 RepID=UPI003520C84B
MASIQGELQGKVALITGAGSGIGKAAALLMGKQGATVIALSRTDKEIKETVAEIEQQGGKGLALTADIASADDMKRVCDTIDQQFGRLDIVFANAGINGVWAPIDELQPDEWQKTIDNNLTGTYLTIHFAVPMLKRQGGAIVITASVNGTRIFSNTGSTAYSCTKAAQVAMAQLLALELAKDKIRVNVVCPGAIDTNIDDSAEQRDIKEIKEPVEFPQGSIPLTDGKPGTSDNVADLVLFLVSDRARHITGTPVWIDGAESLLIG